MTKPTKSRKPPPGSHLPFWPMTAAEQMQFLEQVELGADDACWPWCGNLQTGGYGMFGLKRDGVWRQHLAHRVSWAAHNRAEPPIGSLILHSCDNRKCCNPAHLRPGTHQDNSDDMKARDRHHRLYEPKARGVEAPASVYGAEQRQRAIEMKQVGATFKEIAAEIGCSRITASRWIEEHQIEIGWKTAMSATLARTRPAGMHGPESAPAPKQRKRPVKVTLVPGKLRIPPPDPDSEVF